MLEFLQDYVAFDEHLAPFIAQSSLYIAIIGGAGFALLLLLRMLTSPASDHPDRLFLTALRIPLPLMVLSIGGLLWLHKLNSLLGWSYGDMITMGEDALWVGGIVWIILRYIHLFAQSDKANHLFDPTTRDIVSKLARMVTVLIGVLVLMQQWGININALLALGGGSGLVLGFAGKELLANFFGAMMIYLDKPFAIGDWVRTHDGTIDGIVDEVGLRQTRIITHDRHPVYVPNATFIKTPVENCSQMTHRRFRLTVSLRYSDHAKVDAICADMQGFLADHPRVDHKELMNVSVADLSPSSISLFVQCLLKTKRYADMLDFKNDLYHHFIHVLTQHKAALAAPTHAEHLEE